MTIIAGILIAIGLVIYFTVHFLQVEEMEQRNAYKQAEHEERKAAYLNSLNLKYAGNQPHGYRRSNHLDFTGETPISASRLAEIKREVCK